VAHFVPMGLSSESTECAPAPVRFFRGTPIISEPGHSVRRRFSAELVVFTGLFAATAHGRFLAHMEVVVTTNNVSSLSYCGLTPTRMISLAPAHLAARAIRSASSLFCLSLLLGQSLTMTCGIARLLACALFERALGNRHRRKHIRPADIEGEVRERFGDLFLLEAIVHADVDMAVQLRDLA
jgi:hypothetical protein